MVGREPKTETEGGEDWLKRYQSQKTVLRNKVTGRLLKKIRANISKKNHLPSKLIPTLFLWVEIQLEHGLSIDEVASALNDLNIPTLSGLGVWRSDTIEYLLAHSNPNPTY